MTKHAHTAKTKIILGEEYVCAETVAPTLGTPYFVPTICSYSDDCVQTLNWQGDDVDKYFLRAGLVFLDSDAARAARGLILGLFKPDA